MGDDPGSSVVDVDQRSWEHRNLFLVGSGSFPTMGTSNPTLTMAALTLRTADRLTEELRR
jgi:choline dehydrogenase-like flavoprotein